MKRNNTKKALVLSAISILVCLTMLIGSTFAWFTDTASTAVNKIEAGKLDVQLLKENNTEATESLKWVKADNHESEIVLWEPGCTYNLESVKVKNNGNLALKYKIVITGIQGDAKLNEAIDWTIKLGEVNYTLETEQHLAAGAESGLLTISGHMKEEAGNEYQGLSIEGISITVFAAQDTVEYDSNSNQYDKDATYDDFPEGAEVVVAASEEDFVKFGNAVTNNQLYQGVAVANNPNAYCCLTHDIDWNNVQGLQNNAIGNGNNNSFMGTFEGNGHTISNFTVTGDWSYRRALFRTVGGNFTIRNITFDNAKSISGLENASTKTGDVGIIVGCIGSGNITFENVTIKNSLIQGRTASIFAGTATSGTINFINCRAENVELQSRDNGHADILFYLNSTTYGGKIGTISGNTAENITWKIADSRNNYALTISETPLPGYGVVDTDYPLT